MFRGFIAKWALLRPYLIELRCTLWWRNKKCQPSVQVGPR